MCIYICILLYTMIFECAEPPTGSSLTSSRQKTLKKLFTPVMTLNPKKPQTPKPRTLDPKALNA